MWHSFIFALVISSVFTKASLSQTVPSPLIVASSFYANFSTLQGGVEGTVFPFQAGVTVEGFWSNMDSYIASSGGSNAGALYSFSQGDTDRALGAQTSNKHKTVSIGSTWVFNNTVKQLNASLTGKQFRYGGDNVSNVFTCEYSVMSLQKYQNGGYGGLPNPSPVGWNLCSSLSVVSPINGSSNVPIGPVYATQNLEGVITVLIPAGDVFQIRWTAHDQKDGLAIDDFQLAPIFDSSPSTTSPATTTGSLTPPKSGIDDFWRKFALSGWGLFGFVGAVLALIGACIFYRKKQLRSTEEYQPLTNHENHNLGV